MDVQVDKTHYNFERYSYPGRFASYYYQLRETLALDPKDVLEIGVGDRVFSNYLRDNTDVVYASVDLAEDLSPDYVGSVTALPLKDASYDVTCCFEVLEHLPYTSVPIALSELMRVARRAVVLSVPHFGPRIQGMFKVPLVPEIRFAYKAPVHPKHTFTGEHYWELGKKGFTSKAFRELLAGYGKVTRDFVPFENQYHHFYVVEKTTTPTER